MSFLSDLPKMDFSNTPEKIAKKLVSEERISLGGHSLEYQIRRIIQKYQDQGGEVAKISRIYLYISESDTMIAILLDSFGDKLNSFTIYT